MQPADPILILDTRSGGLYIATAPELLICGAFIAFVGITLILAVCLPGKYRLPRRRVKLKQPHQPPETP
jgi:hypothetical protein